MLCFHYCYTFFLARQNDAPVTKIKICSICGGTWLTRHLECTARKNVLWRGKSKQHIELKILRWIDLSWYGGDLCNVNRLVIVRHQWTSQKSQEEGPLPLHLHGMLSPSECHWSVITVGGCLQLFILIDERLGGRVSASRGIDCTLPYYLPSDSEAQSQTLPHYLPSEPKL